MPVLIRGNIDVHAHLFPTTYMALCRALAENGSPVAADARLTYEHPQRARDPQFTTDIAARLEAMDAAGIETQVLSFSSPNLWHPDESVRVDLVRTFNDGILEVCRQHPGRFKLFAAMPLPFVEASLAETRRLAGDTDVVGAGIPAHISDRPLDEAQLAPLFEAWSEAGRAVFIHPDRFSIPGALSAYGLEWGLGAAFDDTIVTVRLIRSGTAASYPGITWIVPHLGGTLPALLERLDQLAGHAGPGGSALPPLDLSGFLFDTCTPSARLLRMAREAFGLERLTLGTDYPYVDRDDLGAGVRRLETAGLDSDERRAVLSGNAARVLGLADA